MFPAHAVFDALAYFVGARLYFVARRRGDVIESPTRWSVITAAILGAAIGSRLLFLLEDPAATWAHHTDPLFLMGGKTVVGALAQGAKNVLIDLKGVNYIDSTRLGELIASHVTVSRQGGRLTLLHTPARVAELLHLSGLGDVFEQFTSIDAAKKSLS